MRIDFSRCSNDDVAELMIAAATWDEGLDYPSMLCAPPRWACDGVSGKNGCQAYNHDEGCIIYEYGAEEIFRQCWAEIERRSRG